MCSYDISSKRVASVDGFENAKPDLVSALRNAGQNPYKISEMTAGYRIREVKQACELLLSEDHRLVFDVAEIARATGAVSIINLALQFADQHSSYYGVNERAKLRGFQRDIQGVQPQTNGKNVPFHRMRNK